MPDAQCARSLVCEMKRAHKHSHHGHTGFTRHSPRNGLRLISRSPRRSGLFVTVAGGNEFRRLDAGVEASGPHDFAVRRTRASSLRALDVHRIPPLRS